MSDKIERLKAELALAELEEEFVQAKADGSVTMELKLKVRDARAAFRGKYRPQVTVQPGTVEAGTETKTAKGAKK